MSVSTELKIMAKEPDAVEEARSLIRKALHAWHRAWSDEDIRAIIDAAMIGGAR